MKTIGLAIALLAMLLSVSTLRAGNYFYATDLETSLTFPGDINRIFWLYDSTCGPIRTNDWIRFSQNLPLPCGPVILRHGSGWWNDPRPIPDNFTFNAPFLLIPELLTHYRVAAQEQNNFLHSVGEEWYCSVIDTTAFLYHYPEGTLLDTTTAESIAIPLDTLGRVIFVDGKLDVRGELNPVGCKLLIGCSEDIRLVDNVMLAGTDMNSGILPAGATSRIAIASERWVYIGNTPENGRENCGGFHNSHSRCHIVITALVFAVGASFQLEQMNDYAEPYVGPNPDERGNIVLNGGITQRYRGYVHRSNQGGTGYNKVYRWDPLWEDFRAGVLEPLVDHQDEFTDTKEHLFPEHFLLSVSPNPFNATTSIRFSLPAMAHVRAVIYDILGREVVRLADEQFVAGQHMLSVDGSGWASGLYFLRIETLGEVQTKKLMLLK